MDRFVFLSLVVVGMVMANLYISFRVFRALTYSTSQKVAQLLIVWLLPVVGILLVRTFLKEDLIHPLTDFEKGMGDMGPIDLVSTNPDIASGGNVSDDDS